MRVIGLKLLFWPLLASPCWFFKDSSWCIYVYGCYFLVGHWSSPFVPPFPLLDGCLFLCYVWHGFIIIPKGPQKFGSPNKLNKISMILIIDNYLTLNQEWSCKKFFHFLVQFKLNLHWFKFKSLTKQTFMHVLQVKRNDQ
jgi:hypothetical protein